MVKNSKVVKTRKSNDSVSDVRNESSGRRMLIVALVVVLAGCVFTFAQSPSAFFNIGSVLFSSSFLSVLITPSLPIFLVGVFCCLALYLLLTGCRIGRFETVISWIFAVVATCFLLVSALGIGQMCGELTCVTANTFSLSVIFLLNPFAELLWNTLAIAGIISLVRKLRYLNESK